MSYHEYERGKIIAQQDWPFYSLIQAAMRQADSDNIEKLKEAFPEIFKELYARYNTPGGFLTEEEYKEDSKHRCPL